MNTPINTDDSKLTSVRKFWLMWSGQLLSILGSEIVAFAVIWWITGLNTNTQMVTLSYLLLLLPQILLSPLAGFFTDRFNRKIIMIIADVFQAIVTVLMIVLMHFGGIGILGIIILNAVRSIGGVFHRNALQASTTQIVPKNKLSQINSLKFLTEFGVKIIGSLLAALIVELWTLQNIMWIDVATWFVATIFLFGIKIPTLVREVKVEPDKKTHRLKTFTDDYKESFQIIRQTPVLFSLMIISLFTNVALQPINVLLLLFIRNDHGGSAMIFSIIGIVSQIGMLCGALVMSAKKEWKKGGFWMIGGCVVIFFGIVLLKIIPLGTFWLMSVNFFVMFFFLPIINTIYLTYLQRSTPKEAHGRVISIDSTISAIGAPIGVLLSGYFGDLIGISSTYLGAGVLGLIVIFLSSIFGQVHTIKIVNQPEEVHSQEVTNPPTTNTTNTAV
ncbi:Enterobactin exporter EntS [Candidatus Lokiarchaeum ossiferum]|uniref:Enterobactin exporter EntS n=1 Tax=Candidatus Lokiarchaeum ossiferum TaxID=2951803 RepID=A0ABY6HMQ6_9ARCH|nr:Enterobactin exporter EntS [Candidatus Lokiarchaeum sp. B-35]